MRITVASNTRAILLLVLTLALAITAGLRLLGLDRDFEQYEQFFHLSSAELELSRFEPGFKWMASIGDLLSMNFFMFLLAVAFLSVGLKAYVIANTSKRSVVPWMYYLSYYFVLFDMTAIRLGLSIALILFGVYLCSINNRVFGVLAVGLSLLFHYQTLVPIIAFSAIMIADGTSGRFRRVYSSLMLAAAMAAVFWMARNFDFGALGSQGEWAARYLDTFGFTGAAWYQPSIILSIILLWLGRCSLKSSERLVRVAWYVGAFGVTIYYTLSGIAPIAFRLADGLLIFNLFWLGYAAKNASPVDRLTMKIALILFVGYYFWIYYTDDVPYLRFGERWAI